jgi:inhibitor of KinA sporulation pathway (predicted exonuclease)
MAKKIDHVLVIDVESTCWDTRPPQGQISEIIEIGICVVDIRALERRERRTIMVKPMHSQISPFCTQLTSITPAMVADAQPLGDAIRILQQDYNPAERVFAAWGDYDRGQFQRNCELYGLEYPFGPTFLNVKNLFALALGLAKEEGEAAACERIGLPFEGTHHRGGDDAWNVGALLCWLLKRAREAESH